MTSNDFIIVYSGLLDLAVCTGVKCGYALEVASVKRHIRGGAHRGTGDEEAERVTQEQKKSKIQEQKDNSCMEGVIPYRLRKKYIETTDAMYVSGQVLPAVDILPVHDCFKCPTCGYIAPKADTVRKHMTSLPCSTRTVQDIRRVKAQSIFGGNKRKFFEVFQDNDPTTGSCVLSTTMRNLRGSKPADLGADISAMDSFLSVMRFDRHLKACNLSMEKAHSLCFLADQAKRSSFRKLVSEYHKRAFDITERKVYIKTHTFMDSTLSLAVEEKTKDHYDSRASRLIAFVWNSCQEGNAMRKHFSPDIINAIEGMLTNASEQSALQQLHSLLYGLFFSPLHDHNDGLVVFVTCCSVITGDGGKTFRFANASDMSPMMAAIKHFARCVVVMDVYKYGEKDTTLGWDRINKATGSNTDHGIRFVQYCLSVCHRLRDGENVKTRFTLCPKHELCGIIDGVELSVPQLGRKWKGLQKKAWSLLDNHLLNGLKITPHFWSSCMEMQDSLIALTPSYWFGSHSANKHVTEFWSGKLLEQYRPTLLHGDNTVNVDAAKEFLKCCDELQSYLYVLLQTCSGAPARATEISSMRICNSTFGPRNIFINGGMLFTVISYHKSRSMHGGVARPVARFPDMDTAGLLMVYIMVIRPLEATVVQLIHDASQNKEMETAVPATDLTPNVANSVGTQHRDYLFVSRGTRVTVDRLRHYFEKTMIAMEMELTTSQYRQYHCGVVKNFFPFQTDWDEQSTMGQINVLHNQAGHSERTAHQLYGVSSMDMPRLTATELARYRRASKIWHDAVGLMHGPPCRSSDAVSQTGTQSLTEDKPLPQGDFGEIISRMDRMEQLLLELIQSRTDNKPVSGQFEDNSGLKRGTGLLQKDLDSSRKKFRPDPMMSSNVKTQMRNFLDKQDAEFKSKMQEHAVKHCMKSRKDAIIVLPTGGGKSLTFMLPAFTHVEKVVVVVVPLVALQKDLVRRCSDVGIHAALWNSRGIAGARIIIASAEHILSQGYQAYMKEQHALQRLHAIFIDEAHLVLLWKEFREAFTLFYKYVRPKPLDVPVFCLTATAPPSIEGQIAEACGMSDWRVMRMSTSRSNIRYAVIDVKKETMFRQVDRHLCELGKQYSTASCRAIVYVRTRQDCDKLTEMLTLLSPGTPCFKYHAGMTAEDRDVMQCNWEDTSDGRAHVMVATAAFGCGIDAPTVRIVIHAGQPRTLIEFIQESGRAGRDGKVASSVVLNANGPGGSRDPEEDRVPFKKDDFVPVKEHDWSNDMFGTVEGVQEQSTSCRRWLLDEFVDGTSPEYTCQKRGMELCDICQHSNAGATGVPVSSRGFTQPIATTANVGNKSTGSKSTTTAASAQHVKLDYGSRVSPNFCPVCTVLTQRIVEHDGSSNEKDWICYRNRCLRCAQPGHGVKQCVMFKGTGRCCHSCGLRKVDNLVIHNSDEYGRQFCRFKKMMCLAVLCWDNQTLRKQMCSAIDGLENVKRPDQLSKWLLGDPLISGPDGMGLRSFVPWFFTSYLDFPSVE
ncbi:ATP-dependent DNA helicase RecQ putative [Chondrus crispus]|uniref:DNA 3'-5' helicase n=1 Tax=Chondrus crispus TaxID=2769 RepID=R7QNX1_CHOCR|nr:ATP-dependent DNA helicase RecQ putative [Chondrus crispus]CDF39181.1 ATP-dependent DNA helicase RecQ putative [Chondrus crispus]|eukprot:XP_005719092.1 ATP-dependent DNA helicase RecQ putative [Chondrus crispus]